MANYVVAIDPGRTNGIVLVRDTGYLEKAFLIEIDELSLFLENILFQQYRITIVVIEQAINLASQAAFAIRAEGMIEAVCQINQIPYQKQRPQARLAFQKGHKKF